MKICTVSVCSIIFNQKEYLVDYFQGLLTQKTTFPFEILIHDDASTDGTQEIIRSYQKQFPEIIKPIFQCENQYSKRVDVSYFNYDRAQGKYIAVCEGDDYWTDPYKLQKQYEFMEAHPEYSVCCHNATVLEGTKIWPYNKFYGPLPRKDSTLSLHQVIVNDGGYIPTASLFFRRECLAGFKDFKRDYPIGDYPLQMWLALHGKIWYMNAAMSVYRRNASGSYSETMKHSAEYAINIFQRQLQWFRSEKTKNVLPPHEIKFMDRLFEIQIFRFKEQYNQVFRLIVKDLCGLKCFFHLSSLDRIYVVLKILHINPHRLALTVKKILHLS